MEFNEEVKYQLQYLDGISAIFIDKHRIFVVIEEFFKTNDKFWEDIVSAEDILADKFDDVEISVRAHQKRNPDDMFQNLTRII